MIQVIISSMTFLSQKHRTFTANLSNTELVEFEPGIVFAREVSIEVKWYVMLNSYSLKFKKLFYVLAALAVVTSSRSFAAEEKLQQVFLSTEPVPSSEGPARIELQTFAISDEADLEAAKKELIAKSTSKTGNVYTLNVVSTDYRPGALDTEVAKSVKQIEAAQNASVKIPAQSVMVDAPKRSFLRRHYNVTLGVVRFVVNSVIVTTGIVTGRGIPIESASLIGTLAGGMSGIIQVKSDVISKWMTDSRFMVKTAQRLGLIEKSSPETESKLERAVIQAEKYGRWASLEAGFLFVCNTAMSLLNIPVNENLLMTVGKSTASQGLYEGGVLVLEEQLQKINPLWALNGKTTVFRNVAFFAGSAVSALAAIGSMVGMPFSNLGFVTLSAAGVILNLSPKLIKLKPIEQILERWRFKGVLSCHLLFA